MSEYHSPIPSPGEEPVRPVATTIAPGGQTLADALPLLESRLARSPNDATLLLRAAEACRQVGRWDEALGYARRADALAPSTESIDLVIDSLYRVGDQDALEQIQPGTLARASQNGLGMFSMHLLKDRQFARAFALRREIRHGREFDIHMIRQQSDMPWWDGERFDGRLLVIAEEGLGEEFLGASAFLLLTSGSQEAVVECDRRLLPIFRRSFPSLTFARRFTEDLAHARTPGCRRTSTSELVGLLVCNDDKFHNPPGWIVPDPVRTTALQTRYRRQWPGKTLVGISWRSFRPDWGGVHKSLQLTDIAPLLRLAGAAFVSLQYGDVKEELASLAASGLPAPVQDAAIDPMDDLDALAAQVAAMDVVVTTSNTTAHMAGALGKPTVLMLHTTHGVFPYWCYEGESTPWYPTIRIVRGDAATPISEFAERVRSALVDVMAS